MSPTILPIVLLMLGAARLVAAAPISTCTDDYFSRYILGSSLALVALVLVVPIVFIVAEHVAGHVALVRFLHRALHVTQVYALPPRPPLSCAARVPASRLHDAPAPVVAFHAEVANQPRESASPPSVLNPRSQSTGRTRTRQPLIHPQEPLLLQLAQLAHEPAPVESPQSRPFGTLHSNASSFDLSVYAEHSDAGEPPVIKRDSPKYLPTIYEEI